MQMDWIAIMSRFNIILYKTSDIHTHFYSVHTQKWVHEGKFGVLNLSQGHFNM